MSEEKRKSPHGRRTTDCLKFEVQRSMLELIETIKWMAQVVHQARHQDYAGTWKECKLGLCRGAREGMTKAGIKP